MHRGNVAHRVANINMRLDCLVCAIRNANPWWQGVGREKKGWGGVRFSEGVQLGASHAAQLMSLEM